jgi:small-conductance mechanosensitive channel
MIDWASLEWLRPWWPELKAGLKVVAILAGAWVLHAVIARLLGRVRRAAAARAVDVESSKWIETVGRVLRYTASIVIGLITAMLVLNELGVSIAPILGAAGVVGLAVGFGAAFEALRRVAGELRADPELGPRILEDLQIAGIDSLADSAVVLRCRIKVLPLEQWNVRREFLRRAKEAFDAAGVEIPFPHRTIYFGSPTEAAAGGAR